MGKVISSIMFLQILSMILRVERAEQTLLLIRTSSDEVIGAYLSNSWYDRRNSADRSTTKFFGTGESYVFKV
jgi:hypothetical protein